jgi:predicted regulator of Ras-like GTPase activity (Roadblock/LC7/MglB family)
MSDLSSVLKDLQGDVNGFVSTDVVDVESGMSMGGVSADPDFDGSVAAAAFSDVVKAYQRAFELLELDPDSIQDILGTTDELFILTRLLGDEGLYYHGMAITKDGNLALARKMMERYEEPIIDAIGVA